MTYKQYQEHDITELSRALQLSCPQSLLVIDVQQSHRAQRELGTGSVMTLVITRPPGSLA
jgi:hypothetical protein